MQPLDRAFKRKRSANVMAGAETITLDHVKQKRYAKGGHATRQKARGFPHH